MIMTIIRNLMKLVEDKNQRALDMMEHRLHTLSLDLRSELADTDKKLVQVARKPPSLVNGHYDEFLTFVQKREVIQEKIKVVDGLTEDLNAILQRVHAGA